MTRPHTVAVDAPNDLEQPKPLASWYAEGTSDGLGDRLLMFDNAGTPSLELLRFRRHLADADGFETRCASRSHGSSRSGISPFPRPARLNASREAPA